MKQTYTLKFDDGSIAIADVSKVEGPFGEYEVNRVSVPPKHHREGIGTELMREICRDADEAQVKLFLFAAPYGHTQGMNHLQLQRWYEQFGFEVFPLRRGERAKLMVRKPRRHV